MFMLLAIGAIGLSCSNLMNPFGRKQLATITIVSYFNGSCGRFFIRFSLDLCLLCKTAAILSSFEADPDLDKLPFSSLFFILFCTAKGGRPNFCLRRFVTSSVLADEVRRTAADVVFTDVS